MMSPRDAERDIATAHPGTRASIFPESWRSSSCCRPLWAQPELYHEEEALKPPKGFPGWDVIEETFKTPQLYDPPQMKPDYLGDSWLHKLNLLAHRSPFCARPVIPCCCGACGACCQPGQYYTDLAEPDQWFT